MCFGGTTLQTTKRSELPPWLEDAYKRLTQQTEAAGGIGAQYVPYGGQRIAPFTAQQQAAMAGADPVSAYYGQERQAYKPYTDYAAQATMQAGQPTTGMVQDYMSPFQQAVIDTTLQEQQRRSDIAGQQQAGQAVKAGAYGGARFGVQEAERQRNLGDLQARTEAQLRSQNYQQAVGQAQEQQRRLAGMGQQMGGLGAQRMQLGAAGIGGVQQGLQGMQQAGAQQQQQLQQGMDIAYGDFQRQQQFPYSQAAFTGGILSGMPSPQMATVYGQQPGPSPATQMGGLGLAGLGIGNAMGWWGGSDIRLKTDIKPVGKSPSGVNIYSFQYKDLEGTYEGVMAHEVPWASMMNDNGYYMVDYSKVDVEFKKLN